MRFERLISDILRGSDPLRFLVSRTLAPKKEGHHRVLIQGTLLDPQGPSPLRGGINVSLESRTLDDTEFWSGFFEPPSTSGVISGETFRLVLDDGRSQDILRSSQWKQFPPMPLGCVPDPADLPHSPHATSNRG